MRDTEQRNDRGTTHPIRDKVGQNVLTLNSVRNPMMRDRYRQSRKQALISNLKALFHKNSKPREVVELIAGTVLFVIIAYVILFALTSIF